MDFESDFISHLVSLVVSHHQQGLGVILADEVDQFDAGVDGSVLRNS